MSTPAALDPALGSTDDAAPRSQLGAGDEHDQVAAARRGDRVAFSRLHARYAPMVHAIALARAPRTEVEDVVQEVFLVAMDRLAALRDPGAFGGWLATIARNAATERLRRRRVAVPLPAELPSSTSNARGTREDAERVLRLILALPDAYRETLIMRLVEGMDGPQIARSTGMTPGSVRVNLHRGMALLREALASAGGTEDETP